MAASLETPQLLHQHLTCDNISDEKVNQRAIIVREVIFKGWREEIPANVDTMLGSSLGYEYRVENQPSPRELNTMHSEGQRV